MDSSSDSDSRIGSTHRFASYIGGVIGFVLLVALWFGLTFDLTSPGYDSYPASTDAFTLHTAPAPVPVKQQSWQVVATFTGNGTKQTQKFTVRNEWRIRWNTQPGPYGAMNFQIYIYSENGELDGVAANVIGSSQDVSYQHRSGTFYLTINTAQPYSIAVDELR